MSKSKIPVNPFYVLLVPTGILFALTACAYGVMVYRADRATRGELSSSGGGLMELMEQRGGQLLAVELVVLAVATVAAILWDRFWMRRAERAAERQRPSSP